MEEAYVGYLLCLSVALCKGLVGRVSGKTATECQKASDVLVIVCNLFLDYQWARCLITSPRVVKILGVLPFHAHRSLATSVTLYYNEELRLSGATKFIWRVLLLNPVCEC